MNYQPFDSIDQQLSQPTPSAYYYFFNTGSGSVRAKQFLYLDCATITVPVNGKDTKVSFFSIQNLESRVKGYQQLKLDLCKVKQMPIIIGGGDGTIMWVVEQMLENNIDIEQTIIIPVPLGTGNDFSNALGWGTDVPSDLLGKEFVVLRQMISQWNKGHQCYFDIWDVRLTTAMDGCLTEVIRTADGYIKQNLKDKDGYNLQTFEKKMSNYFSIGVDARIGYGFDKNRTSSKHVNKLCYCIEGVKKLFIHTRRVNQVIDFVEHYHMSSDQPKTLFKTANGQLADTLTVPGNPANLVCLNINSYSAGVKDIWQNAKKPIEFKQQNHQEKTSFSDGLLEFFSFDSIVGIGGERMKPGNATRLAQTSGPLQIRFREYGEAQLSTYFQVDGQFFCVVNPTTVEIEACKQLPNGKIRVLCKNG